jgi:transcriptional regulator with XRE-family HTH domain
MSEAGLYTAMNRGTLKVRDLEKIAKVLNVPVSYFFEDEDSVKKENIGGHNIIQNGNGTNNKLSISLKDSEIDKLHVEIQGLKREVELLKEMNEMLKGRK